MLKPNSDRLEYGKMLIPPVGFKTAFAVGTTYSLDLETLLGVSIALGLNEDTDSCMNESPLFLLEALRKVSAKMLVFSETGQIAVPKNANRLFLLLEQIVITVKPPDNKSFHPKLWLIKYENESGEAKFRMVVLSRNLTFDHSWDIALGMEGTRRNRIIDKTEPVSDFLAYLSEHINPGDKNMSSKRESLLSLAKEMKQVEFELEDKTFENYSFLPIGIGGKYGKANTGLFGNYSDLLVVSPFLSKNVMEELRGLQRANAAKCLITRKGELFKLSAEFLEDFETYTVRDEVIDGEDRISEEGEPGRQDIHAKIYLRTNDSKPELFIGSANASNNAFCGNVEFLLCLQAGANKISAADLKNDLFGTDERFNPFEKVQVCEYQPAEIDTTREALEKAIKDFCRSDLAARITDGYTATIEIKGFTALTEMYLSPITTGQKVRISGENVAFNNLALEQLSEFYVVTAEKDERQMSRVLKIRTIGMPADRDSKIFSAIVKEEGFIKYISFLLGDDYLMSFIEDGIRKSSGYQNLTTVDTPVLYEKMLKAAARTPDKIREIKKVVEMINDKNVIPAEFTDLYSVVTKAVMK